MAAPPIENPIDPPAAEPGHHTAIGRSAWFLLGAIVVVWAGSAALLVNGIPEPVSKLSAALGTRGIVLVLALIVSGGLLSVLALDRRLTLARDTARRAERRHALLAQVLDAFPIPVQIKDADLRCVWINAEMTRRWGLTASGMIGKRVDEIGTDPTLAASVMAHDLRVLATGLADGPEEQVARNPDGRITHIAQATKVPLIEDGKVTHIVTVGADLTALRERQLRNEEERRLLEAIMDAAPITIQVADRDLVVSWANRSFREHHVWLTGEDLGRSMAEATSAAGLMAETVATNAAILAGERTLVQSEQHYPATANRPERYFLVTKAPLHDQAGRVTRVLTMGTDITALKQAEAAADTANRLIEGILQNVPLAIQVKDSDLRFRWVNRAFGQHIGRDAGSLLGLTVDDLDIPPAAKARAIQQDRAVLTNCETIHFDERLVIAGATRQMMVIKAPLTDAAGRATHVISIGADVTEMHRLQTEADDARRGLQLVIDSVPVTIALKGADRRYKWVNREFERVTGLTAADVTGRRADELLPDPIAVAAVDQQDLELLAGGGEAPPIHQQPVSASGETRHYSVRRVAVRDADGAIEGILTVGTDVTELLLATSELRRLNEALEQRVAERAAELAKVNDLVAAVIQSSPVPIVTFRSSGAINSWNPAATRLTGYTEAEALGGLLPERTGKRESQFAEMARLIRAGASFSNLEARRRHKDGREIDLLISGAPLRRSDGTIEGAVCIWLDVTEQRAMERQLRQAQRMEAVGQLTGGVAHDFNNLLAVVIGTLDLLLVTLPADEDNHALVNQAIEAAERGAALTRRLLAFARQQTLRPVVADIHGLVLGMQPLLQRAVGETIAIRCPSADDLWLALIDTGELENAILNLSVNARDAMPKGGTLTIATGNAVLDQQHTEGQPDVAAGDYVFVSVTDTGSGIAPDILGRVFEPFFTTKEVGKGSGLGLSMVFGFVKQSGGHVRIDSEPGQGTCITLYLPRVLDPSVELRPEPVRDQRGLEPHRHPAP